MDLTDEDLKKIEQSAEEMKNYKFLIQIKTLQEIREVKKLLRIIARNTEQKDVDKVAECLEEIIEKETLTPTDILSRDELN